MSGVSGCEGGGQTAYLEEDVGGERVGERDEQRVGVDALPEVHRGRVGVRVPAEGGDLRRGAGRVRATSQSVGVRERSGAVRR